MFPCFFPPFRVCALRPSRMGTLSENIEFMAGTPRGGEGGSGSPPLGVEGILYNMEFKKDPGAGTPPDPIPRVGGRGWLGPVSPPSKGRIRYAIYNISI